MPEADQSETNSPAASGPEVTRNDEQGRYEIREGEDLLGFAEFTEVQRVLDQFLARPAVQRGLTIPART